MARYKNKEESTKARFKKFLDNEMIKLKTNYDFSASNFTTQSKPLTFRCSIHDKEITVAKASFLYDTRKINNKCTECHKEFKDFFNAESFIVRAKRRYNSKYQYLDIEDYNTHKEITFICPKHGEQKHTPSNHMQSITGCSECGRESSGDSAGFSKSIYIKRSEKSNVYVIKIKSKTEDFYKIGITYKEVEDRFYSSNLPSEYSYSIKYFFKALPTSIAYDLEKKLHEDNIKYQYKPNIKFAGHTECFTTVPDDKSYYLKMIEGLIC